MFLYGFESYTWHTSIPLLPLELSFNGTKMLLLFSYKSNLILKRYMQIYEMKMIFFSKMSYIKKIGFCYDKTKKIGKTQRTRLISIFLFRKTYKTLNLDNKNKFYKTPK